MDKIVEICCGSYYDALEAYHGGAKRIELNSALHLGGLTPSLSMLIQTKQNTDLKVICMVRNRGAGFQYDELEAKGMYIDAKILLENGADGIAFGFLNEDRSVNKEWTKRMVDLIHSYGKEAVFHRAIDVSDDMMQACADIIECGADRILTSGGYAKAPEGISKIKMMQDAYGDKIEFLAGSGINETNASYVMENTGVYQVHSSCKEWKHDITTSRYGVDFSYASVNKYEVVAADKVKNLIDSVK